MIFLSPGSCSFVYLASLMVLSHLFCLLAVHVLAFLHYECHPSPVWFQHDPSFGSFLFVQQHGLYFRESLEPVDYEAPTATTNTTDIIDAPANMHPSNFSAPRRSFVARAGLGRGAVLFMCACWDATLG